MASGLQGQVAHRPAAIMQRKAMRHGGRRVAGRDVLGMADGQVRFTLSAPPYTPYHRAASFLPYPSDLGACQPHSLSFGSRLRHGKPSVSTSGRGLRFSTTGWKAESYSGRAPARERRARRQPHCAMSSSDPAGRNLVGARTKSGLTLPKHVHVHEHEHGHHHA